MAISREDSKIWFDVTNTKPIFVNPFKSNHTQDVLNDPKKYRLSPNYFTKEKEANYKYDYDGYVLIAAMRNNFVRIAVDVRDPGYGSNLEAISLTQLQKAALWFKEFVGYLKRVILVERYGYTNKDAKVHVLNTPEQIDFFLQWGKILVDKLPEKQTA